MNESLLLIQQSKSALYRVVPVFSVPGRPVVSLGSALGTALGIVPKTADATTSTTIQRPARHALGECLSAKEVTYVKSSSVRPESAVDSDDERLSGEDIEPPANGLERGK